MVLLDADDRGSERLGDVGRVEAAAHADLEHGHVHARAAEVVEGGGGEHLEVRGVGGDRARADQARGRATDAVDGGLERGGTDVPPPHRDALVDVDEMGRGVAPDGEARGAQGGVGVGHDRALSVGARDEQ